VQHRWHKLQNTLQLSCQREVLQHTAQLSWSTSSSSRQQHEERMCVPRSRHSTTGMVVQHQYCRHKRTIQEDVWLTRAHQSINQLINQSINQSLCGVGDLGGQCASNSQIHIYIHPKKPFHNTPAAADGEQRSAPATAFELSVQTFALTARLRAR
jgi:hypothetical protein